MNKKLLVIYLFSTFITVMLWNTGVIKFIDKKVYDLHFVLRGQRETHKDIVIVAIDEKSLNEFGRWPWDREIVAKGIEKLKSYGAKVICLDVLFVDKGDERKDILLGESMKDGNIVNSIYFDYKTEIVTKQTKEGIKLEKVEKICPISPIEPIKRNTKLFGFVNAYPDTDGVLRKALLSFELNGEIFYSLNLQTAVLFSGKKQNELTNEKEIYVNFRKPSNGYTTYSFCDLYKGVIPKEWINGKIIIVGSTAIGAYDHYPTPYDSVYPGVEFHATVIDNLLKKDYFKVLNDDLTILFLVLCSLIYFLLIINLNVLGITFAIFLSIMIFSISSLFIFSNYNFYINSTIFLFNFLFIGGISSLYKFSLTEKEKRFIKKVFSYYVSPEVVKELISNPKKLKLGGEKKRITVMFADIKDFTKMASNMKPEELVELLNDFMSEMTEVIFSHGGTLDKYIGDEIMAFWGAPIDCQNHAEKCLVCVIDMLKRIKNFNKNGSGIKIGIGINTGEAIVGNLGSNKRLTYTACGECVNLASRLQTLTRHYNTDLLISENTYNELSFELKNRVVYLDTAEIKGIEGKVKLFTLAQS